MMKSGSGLLQGCRYFANEVFRQLFYGARGQPRFLHLLRSGVERLHPHVVELQFRGIINVGVGELKASAEDAWFAKNYVFFADDVIFIDILRPVEPYEVADSMPVGEMGHYPFLASAHLELLEAEDVSLDLHERHVGHQLWYEVDFGSVNVFVRIILKKRHGRC